MLLNIIIPTFNRNEILNETVSALLPQLNSQCRVIIGDNHCEVPVSKTLEPLLKQFPDCSVEIRRNHTNIGMAPNILRYIEEFRTGWVWILGDDDPPLPNAVQTILRYVEEYPNCLYFNFGCGSYAGFSGRESTFFTTGLREFVEKVDSIANVFKLSTGINKAEMFLDNLRMSYAYSYTAQVNTVPLLAGLGESGVCCFSKDDIVTHQSPTSPDQAWSFVQFSLGIMGLLELPIQPSMEPDVRKKLALKICASLPRHKYLALQLMFMTLQGEQLGNVLFLYDQMCHRLYHFDKSPRRRFEIMLYRLMVRFPRVSFLFYSRLRGMRVDIWAAPKRFQRL